MSSRLRDNLQDEPELLEHIASIDLLVESVPPPLSLREALFDTLSPRPKFLGYGKRLSHIFDVGEEQVRASLDAMADRSKWLDIPGGGRFFPVAEGQRTKGARMGFVEFAAGMTFPRHRHQGLEVQFVMTGRLLETEGHEYLPGDLLVREVGSEHEFSIGPEAACICAIVLYADVDFI